MLKLQRRNFSALIKACQDVVKEAKEAGTFKVERIITSA